MTKPPARSWQWRQGDRKAAAAWPQIPVIVWPALAYEPFIPAGIMAPDHDRLGFLSWLENSGAVLENINYKKIFRNYQPSLARRSDLGTGVY